MINKLFNEIRNQVPLFQSQRRFLPREIHSAESFRRIMERERARTDRTGVGFSLVLFGMDKGVEDIASSCRVLADHIRNKVRIGDEVGWFDDECLAAFLPGTPEEGAWIFAGKVLDSIEADIPLPSCRVFSYPAAASSSRGNPAKAGQLDIPFDGEAAGDTGSMGSMMNGDETPDGRIETVFAPPVLPWKRTLDVIGALAGLILLSPLFLLLAILIKAVSPGPVFFRQKRVGHMGKTFTLWKFRTMKTSNDPTAHRQHLSRLIRGDDPMKKLDEERDPRIIPFGNILRQSCLDELPQLINVLLGDMSLVGPRPCLPYEAREYHLWQKRRFDTIPGMTGLWQVSGKNRTTFKEMVRLDIAYTRRMSPWLDVKIILKTIPVIVVEVADKLGGRIEIPTSADAPPKGDSK